MAHLEERCVQRPRGKKLGMLWNSLEAMMAGGYEHEVRVGQEGMEIGLGPAQGQELEFS